MVIPEHSERRRLRDIVLIRTPPTRWNMASTMRAIRIPLILALSIGQRMQCAPNSGIYFKKCSDLALITPAPPCCGATHHNLTPEVFRLP